MNYYGVVTNVEANEASPGHVNVTYELREGDEREFRVVMSGQFGLVQPISDDASTRRGALRAQVEEHLLSLVERAKARDEDIDAIRDELIGLTVKTGKTITRIQLAD